MGYLIGWILFSAFSLYWLPEWALLDWQQQAVCAVPFGFGLCGLCGKKWRKPLLLTGMGLGITLYFHAYALNALQQAKQIAHLEKKINGDFVIEQILHRQSYQTLLVRAKLSPALGEQRIFVNWQVNQMANIGEHWHGELRLRPISSRLNQGGFDRQQWYFANHIQASATIKKATLVSENGKRAGDFSSVFTWRNAWLEQAIQQTEGLSQQGLLLALGFGERAWLDNASWQGYQHTGTAHLIAISGLHIGLAMLLGVAFGRALQLLLPTSWISPSLPLISGLLFATLYAQLAGFTIPTLRALIALFIFSLIRLRRDYYSPWQLYFRTLAFLLLLDPLMILSTSFLLSAGAVFCLILYYQLFPFQLLEWRGKPIKGVFAWLLRLIHLQIGLLWFFTPVQLAVFHGISIYAFLANLLLVPLFSLCVVPLVCWAIISNGAFSSWQIANYFAELSSNWLAILQNGWIFISEAQGLWINLSLLCLLLVSLHWLYGSSKTRRANWLMPKWFTLKSVRYLSPQWHLGIKVLSIGWIVFTLAYWSYQRITESQWRLETLDVGQGLATLIVKNGRAVLFDSGASWRGGSMAQLEIIPYLQRQGLDLDTLIISHDDNDHAGGVVDMMKYSPPKELISASEKNYLALEKNTKKIARSFCQQGREWQWQGLQFKVLSPQRILPKADNHHSCMIIVADKQHLVLLTGDADSQAERQVLAQLSNIDVLQVGHHGSKTSTSLEFVNKTQPKIALISSGRWNPWHFPHSSVMARLAQSQIYNTAISGQISLYFYNDHLRLETARDDYSPWYRQIIDE